MHQRKLVKKITVHNKAPLDRTDFVADLHKSLEQKEKRSQRTYESAIR